MCIQNIKLDNVIKNFINFIAFSDYDCSDFYYLCYKYLKTTFELFLV